MEKNQCGAPVNTASADYRSPYLATGAPDSVIAAGAETQVTWGIHVSQSGFGAGPGGLQPVLAQASRRKADRLQGDPRRDHAAGGIEARRSRYRLFDPRRAGRGAEAHARIDPEAAGRPRRVLPLFPRPVGSEITLA